MKRLTLLFGALLAAALCTLPTADAAAQPKPTKYNLCRKHPADGPYIVYDAEKGAYAATADKRGRVRVMPYGGGPVEVRSSRGAYLFSVTPHAVERGPRELPQAPKLFVTSDLHGDFRSFATLLQAHGVIDGDCRWSYGNNQLAVIGDIFDRGPRADYIMDMLMAHHCVDIQWGNHDILWMGAAAGNEACMMNVLNLALQYNTLDIVENGYGISLRDMIAFAQETYRDCTWFMPRNPDDKDYLKSSMDTLSKVHKAVAILQFKLEGQLLARHPEYGMEDRRLLSRIDYQGKTVSIDGREYPLNDCHFPTIDPADPYALTVAEEKLVQSLREAFRKSERLQRHAAFLYSHGSMYKRFNGNLLFHGCIPMEEDGTFTALEFDGQTYSGRALMDYADAVARKAYYSTRDDEAHRNCVDFMWYLWCGRNSPLFGREKITTFERYFVSDRDTWAERKNAYYRHIAQEETCRRILQEFGLDPEESHIINGHVPVRTRQGESPIKAGGRLLVIDGGFCKAYHDTTGIAGYTLIYSSRGMTLVSHERFDGIEAAIKENKDILSTSSVFERTTDRRRVEDTDIGTSLRQTIRDLEQLLSAYRLGVLTPKEE